MLSPKELRLYSPPPKKKNHKNKIENNKEKEKKKKISHMNKHPPRQKATLLYNTPFLFVFLIKHTQKFQVNELQNKM